VQLHKAVREPVLSWDVKLVHGRTMHIAFSMHSQGSVGAEELILGITDAHAYCFPSPAPPHAATPVAGGWDVKPLLVGGTETHGVIIKQLWGASSAKCNVVLPIKKLAAGASQIAADTSRAKQHTPALGV